MYLSKKQTLPVLYAVKLNGLAIFICQTARQQDVKAMTSQ